MAIGRKEKSSRGIWLVAVFKLFKGLVLLAVGIGALRQINNRDLAREIMRWADTFRVDPRNHYLYLILSKTLLLNPAKMRQFGVGSLFYSALLLTEGTGLALQKPWAQYFTIISTGAFLPLEVYELTRGVSLPKVLVLVFNIAVVIYLAIEVYERRRRA